MWPFRTKAVEAFAVKHASVLYRLGGARWMGRKFDTLAREAGEEISADLTKAQASEHIDRLQQATGRGQGD